MNYEKINNYIKSKKFKSILYIIGILAVVFVVFEMGMMAGFRKASFGREWGDNYERNFGFPAMGPQMMGGEFGGPGNFPNAHGAIGKIIKIELPNIIVQDEKDNTEKNVLTTDKTEIKIGRDTQVVSELKLDDHIVVIGSPNTSGQLEARLIRILPAPLPVSPETN